MSAFSRSLAAIQTLAVAAWGPDVKLRFECALDVPFDADFGTALYGSSAWRCWLVGGPEPAIEGVSNTGVGALDALLGKLITAVEERKNHGQAEERSRRP